MPVLLHRIANRVKSVHSAWKSDMHFSWELACFRVVDDLSYRLGLRKLSDAVHWKKEKIILNYLDKDLSPIIERHRNTFQLGEKVENAPIWVCWWTGIDCAPPLVKKCIESIYRNAGEHPVFLITKDNYSQYLGIPEYILEKMEKGTMKTAHFSDYLRVSLLNRYGGLWLDSTIFCPYPISDSFFSLPIFTCKSSFTQSRFLSHFEWTTFCLGSWRNNSFFSCLQELFESYWKNHEYAIDYLFFDDLIYLVRRDIPDVRKLMDMIPQNNPHRDNLQAAMNAACPAEQFWMIVNHDTALYKLSWREKYQERTENGEFTVYHEFLNI